MPGSIKGHMLLQRYQDIVDELYCQPKDEIIMGSFLERNVGRIEPARANKRKRIKKAVQQPTGSKDIRHFFQKRH